MYSQIMVWTGTKTWDMQEESLRKAAEGLPSLEKVIPKILHLWRMRDEYSPSGSLKNLSEINTLQKQISFLNDEIKFYIEKQTDLNYEQKEVLKNWYGVMPSELRKKWAQGMQEEIMRFSTRVKLLTHEMDSARLVLPSSVWSEGRQYKRFRKEASSLRNYYDKELSSAASFAKTELYTTGNMFPPPDEILQECYMTHITKMSNALDALRESYFKHSDYAHSVRTLWLLALTVFTSLISIGMGYMAYTKRQEVFLKTDVPIQVQVPTVQ